LLEDLDHGRHRFEDASIVRGPRGEVQVNQSLLPPGYRLANAVAHAAGGSVHTRDHHPDASPLPL